MNEKRRKRKKIHFILFQAKESRLSERETRLFLSQGENRRNFAMVCSRSNLLSLVKEKGGL